MENFSDIQRNKEDDKIIVYYQECTVDHLFVRPSSEQYRIPLLKELITRRMKTLSTDFCNFDTVEDANVNGSQAMVTNTVATTNLPPSSSHSVGHQAQTSSSVGTSKWSVREDDDFSTPNIGTPNFSPAGSLIGRWSVTNSPSFGLHLSGALVGRLSETNSPSIGHQFSGPLVGRSSVTNSPSFGLQQDISDFQEENGICASKSTKQGTDDIKKSVGQCSVPKIQPVNLQLQSSSEFSAETRIPCSPLVESQVDQTSENELVEPSLLSHHHHPCDSSLAPHRVLKKLKPSKLKLKQQASTKLPPAITPINGVEAAINNSLVPVVATISTPRSFASTVPVVVPPLAKKIKVFKNATSLPKTAFVEKPFKRVTPRKPLV